MVGTFYASLDVHDFAEHLQAQQSIETAQFSRIREWKAELPTLERKARYRAKNRALLRHKQAMLRAAKLNAIPTWLTKEQEHRILKLHEKAVEREFWSKVPHDVHHSVPLCGKCSENGDEIACGLHVPWNLEVLPRKENLNLGARFDGFVGFDCDDIQDSAPF